MPEPVSIVLVAVGGYGNNYANVLLDAADQTRFKIAGVVDPFAEGCRRLEDLKGLGLPFHDTLDEFYARRSADLAVISSLTALENGSNVLCEKPLCPTIQEARQIIEARDRTDRFVAVGYQWSYSPAIQELKRDILEGRYGRLIRARTIVLWPRNEAYYKRNNWAGALDDGAGNWILDSPVNNATAHYLHNMLYVVGPRVDRSIRPTGVVAELYRANPITNYDTGAARIQTEGGAEMLYIAAHAVAENRGPESLFEFEGGTVHYGGEADGFEGRPADGSVVAYGDPFDERLRKVWVAIEAVAGQADGVCGPEAASAQTLVVNGMQDSAQEIVGFPDGDIVVEGIPGERKTRVGGLDGFLGRCYNEFKLPSEMNADWAVAGRPVELTDYTHFPSR